MNIKLKRFQKELEQLLNKHSMEMESNTPDYILAEYLTRILDAWNHGVYERHRHETGEEIHVDGVKPFKE